MNDWYLSNMTVIQTSLVAFLLALSMQVTMRVGVLSVAGIGFYAIAQYSTALMVMHEILPWGLADRGLRHRVCRYSASCSPCSCSGSGGCTSRWSRWVSSSS